MGQMKCYDWSAWVMCSFCAQDVGNIPEECAGGGCPFLIYSPSQHHHPVSPVLGGWEEDCWVILGPLSLGQDLHGLDCL